MGGIKTNNCFQNILDTQFKKEQSQCEIFLISTFGNYCIKCVKTLSEKWLTLFFPIMWIILTSPLKKSSFCRTETLRRTAVEEPVKPSQFVVYCSGRSDVISQPVSLSRSEWSPSIAEIQGKKNLHHGPEGETYWKQIQTVQIPQLPLIRNW